MSFVHCSEFKLAMQGSQKKISFPTNLIDFANDILNKKIQNAISFGTNLDANALGLPYQWGSSSEKQKPRQKPATTLALARSPAQTLILESVSDGETKIVFTLTTKDLEDVHTWRSIFTQNAENKNDWAQLSDWVHLNNTNNENLMVSPHYGKIPIDSLLNVLPALKNTNHWVGSYRDNSEDNAGALTALGMPVKMINATVGESTPARKTPVSKHENIEVLNTYGMTLEVSRGLHDGLYMFRLSVLDGSDWHDMSNKKGKFFTWQAMYFTHNLDAEPSLNNFTDWTCVSSLS